MVIKMMYKTLTERLYTDNIDIQLEVYDSKVIYVTLNNIIIPHSSENGLGNS
jgi:hypothetical protein